MQPKKQAMHDRIFYLRRKVKPKHRHAGGLLEIAPWIDVVLIVLIFFMIHSAALVKPGIEVNLPVASTTGGARYDAMVVTVPNDSFMLFDDERITEERLSQLMLMVIEENPDRELIIEADGGVSYAHLTRIYNLAVEAGFQRILMATRVESKEDMSL